MKLLTSLTSWKQWIKSEEGRFADAKHPLPKSFPCYGYMELESWGQETLRPVYLYQSDVEAMAVELIAAAQQP